MFCPKCKLLLYPQDGKLVCKKCGYVAKNAKKEVVEEKHEGKEIPILKDKLEGILPREKTTCPKCGHNEAYYITKQTRAADEAETRIYTCCKCNHRWREY